VEGDIVSQVRETIRIAAPPASVWELISDIPRHTRFAGPRSITKEIEFAGPLEAGSRWIAHEKFGPQKFDAPSELTKVEPERELSWISFPPMKDRNRGRGGKVLWSYMLEPAGEETILTHTMDVIEPMKGGRALRTMYAVLRLPEKQRAGVKTTLENVKLEAERSSP
jgi:uncharacterized protein YndB with AHSA1/START domain